MSITIHQSPTGYTSAHEEVWHVVESTDKNITGFQYVYDIYKGAELLTRVKNSPLGASKLGVLDVGNIVRSALDSYNFPNIDAYSFDDVVQIGADIFWTDYDVRYGQVSGVAEVSGNLASGTYRVYNNYYRSRLDKKQSEITGAMILSNRPVENAYYVNNPVILSVFLPSGQIFARQEVINNTVSSQYTHAGNGNAFVFGFSPSNGDTSFQLSGSVSGIIGALNFNKKCAKYESHTLVFLNAFGAYDSFTFVHGKLMMSNEKKKFEQMRWQLSGNSMVEKSGFVYNEGVKTYAVKYKERMMLTTDILSTGEYNWLSELINSPQVYYLDTDGIGQQDFHPVQITDTDYEFKDDRINKTDTLSVTIEFSIPQNTQYR